MTIKQFVKEMWQSVLCGAQWPFTWKHTKNCPLHGNIPRGKWFHTLYCLWLLLLVINVVVAVLVLVTLLYTKM